MAKMDGKLVKILRRAIERYNKLHPDLTGTIRFNDTSSIMWRNAADTTTTAGTVVSFDNYGSISSNDSTNQPLGVYLGNNTITTSGSV